MTHLKDIKTRLEAATPGPWYVINERDRPGPWTTEIWKDSKSDIEPAYSVSPEKSVSGWRTDSGNTSYCLYKNDAEFIAHAPTDIAFLLEKLERCESEIFNKIKHGDENHQEWLRDALHNYFKEVFGDDETK